MNKHSILLKISVSFFIAIIAITALFNIIQEHEYANEKEKLREHYHHMAMAIMKWKMGQIQHAQLMAKLHKENMSMITDPVLHQKIKSKVSIKDKSCSVGDFYVYEQETFRYIIIPPIFGKVLLKDEKINPIDVSYVWWLYGAFVLIILLLYISIVVSLYPLKKLQVQIQRFGEGETDIDLSSTRKDEIAEVANEFNKAVQKIQEVLEARKIFLRNITHEFKTPLTSGKLALELLGSSKPKDVLNNVFTRLELLLKEFVRIEKITAIDNLPKLKEYPLTDILDQAIDMLYLEPNSIKNNLSDSRLKVNFELFTLVFKNLIDNGLKYSQENEFCIEIEDNQIHFISKGEKMDESLEYYLQPFTKSDTKSAQSFGLGLYIVDAILKKHHFSFSYQHTSGYNFFTINK
ncbi:MAG: two-component system OmpR family sensor kinase [Sulfurimonas sp.]|uniref:ArsS family sensor histidine kinase n=1 Tax=Sulfurimonas sp. TaxID=2022749 RepID=UPI0039E61849